MNEKPTLKGKITPFEEIRGPKWQEYQLADGNLLRIKMEVLKILSTGQKNPQTGEPIYNFQTNITATVYTEEQGYVRAKK